MAAASPSAETSASAALRAYCESFAARDLEGMVALFHPHAVCEIPNWPRRAYGREQIRRALARVTPALEHCEIDLVHVAAHDAVALGEGTISATRLGATLEFPFGMVVETEGESIVRLTEYFDVAPFAPAR